MDQLPGSNFYVSLGVGGLLAWGMFLLYRRDMNQRLDEWKGQSAQLLVIVENNTRVVTLLNERLERLERTAERLDLERMTRERLVKSVVP